MNEEWKSVVGYEGLYEVSNLGRVKSLERIAYKGKKHSQLFIVPSKILSPKKTKCGYLAAHLSKDGKDCHIFIHRLVAQAFLPNPEGLPQVNHKDEDKTNNAVWNLEWCSAAYNNAYGTHNERCAEANRRRKPTAAAIQKAAEKHKKPVIALKDGVVVLRYDSAADANRDNKNFSYIGISACCNGRINTYRGYKWQFID